MVRVTAIGFASLVLMACQPAAEPAAPAVDAASTPATQDAPVNGEDAIAAILQMETPPADPVDAFVWRATHCMYLGGEFNGDGGERDKYLGQRMDELHCGDELLADGRALRAAKASDPAALAKINAALNGFEG